MLNFMFGDMTKILEAKDVKAIERHGSSLESIIDKANQLKLQVQQLRIENNDDPAEVRLWTETQISNFEEILKEVKHVATGIRSAEEEKRGEEKRK